MEDDNQKAIKELEEIGYPPYENHEKDVMVQRKWLMKYGGVEINVNTLREIIVGSFISPEYSLVDLIRFARGNYFTREMMFNEIKDLNFFSQYPELEVPVYFIAGRYDYNTPSELVEHYYETLLAPKKEFFWFENSAHDPHFEEPAKFSETMLYIKEVTFQN